MAVLALFGLDAHLHQTFAQDTSHLYCTYSPLIALRQDNVAQA